MRSSLAQRERQSCRSSGRRDKEPSHRHAHRIPELSPVQASRRRRRGDPTGARRRSGDPTGATLLFPIQVPKGRSNRWDSSPTLPIQQVPSNRCRSNRCHPFVPAIGRRSRKGTFCAFFPQDREDSCARFRQGASGGCIQVPPPFCPFLFQREKSAHTCSSQGGKLHGRATTGPWTRFRFTSLWIGSKS